ncbi:MAG: type I-C CRISPR-associated protein Cas8c/Csd1 [Proteobacteria bacterium]|nr:type I-C CRISPR-associated protein Cas8c/Csd1 [Pseudomonadota bacterium]
MILQALKDYYDRKSSDAESKMAPPGFEWKEIPFVIMLKSDGTPISINSTYEGDGKKRRAKRFLVPQAVKKTSGIASNLFWDNPEYVLGVDLKGKPERVVEQHETFVKKIEALEVVSDEGVSAVKSFLRMEKKVFLLQGFGDTWQQLISEGGNVTFQLAGDPWLVSERPNVKSAISDVKPSSDQEVYATCLVTGQKEDFERLHPPIKGVYGAQSSGANIVSFNLDAFKSFGKSQGANSPVGKNTVFAYTTALNHLLSKDSKQRMQVGDASTVFWAEKESDLEHKLPDLFGEPPKDDPDRGAKAVESLYRSIENGSYMIDNNDRNRFYVLGLSPNAARIAIRFWIVDTVSGMAEKISRHFEDIRIVHGPKEKDVLSLFRLLVSTAVLGKSENIPPNLAGETMRAILQGLPYPYTLLQASIRRIRAEHDVTYPRAAMIKACINRSTRFKNPHIKEELHMSLDENNTNIGYRLGRLFATLEKIQQEANPGINATIRDRFYGAASGTPSTVFGNLMRLKNHHLAKLENVGRKIFFEKLLGQIIDGIDAAISFPTHLSLEDQGKFAIGYYHQVQKFFTKNVQNEENLSK